MNTSVRRPGLLKKRSGVARGWEGLQRLEERVLCTIALTLDQVPTFYTKSNGVLTGTVSDIGSPVRLAIAQSDGSFIAIPGADVDGNGHWSLHLNAVNGIPNGRFDIAVTANHNGDTGQVNIFDAFVIDDTAPTMVVNATGSSLTTNPAIITGTYNDANMGSVVVKLDDGGGGITTLNAVLNTGNKTWSAVVSGGTVPGGTYGVSVVGSDLSGNQTTVNVNGVLTLDTVAPVVSTTTVMTGDATPALSGTVDDPAAVVTVTLHGTAFPAVNHGDGTWTIADNVIPTLANGVYRPVVTATDPAGNVGTFNGAVLVVNGVAPKVTVDTVLSMATSPALSGTVSDPGAEVLVTVNGNSYLAVNNGDGTWTIGAGIVAALPTGTYNVAAAATNAFGGQGADATTNELTVATAQTITLGGAITSLSYVDADGTTVTVTAGKGAVALTLVGLDVAVTGTGKTRKVTATGGVRQLDIDVQAATKSLAFKTNNGGDALTAIRKITGSGVLATLTGAAVDLTGGITMTGSIGSMTLRSICGDVTMSSAPAGVSIVANFFSNSTITVPTIKTLTAKTRFSNTRVVATTVLTATLNNVQTNNHGAAFGITAASLKALTVVQAGTSLKWKKQFTTGILDFAVVAPLV